MLEYVHLDFRAAPTTTSPNWICEPEGRAWGPVLGICQKTVLGAPAESRHQKGGREMSSMIERVAQAIAHEMGYRDPEAVRFAARAAIAAMREPSEEMIVAWIKAPGAIKGGWQGMIDAALEGK